MAGGMSANGWLAQDIADMCRLPVRRPADVETTARGAAIMAAVGAGLFPNLGAAADAMTAPAQAFSARELGSERNRRLSAWWKLVEQA